MHVSTKTSKQEQSKSYQIGHLITELSLPAIDGSRFNLKQIQGKRYLLSFMRFAACPFCQLRIHELISRWQELSDDFTVIAVFDSPLSNLQKQAGKQSTPFPILADEYSKYYDKFAIRRSLTGTLKAMLFRMPMLLNAMFVKGYFPSSIKGEMTTMPADILVDEQGMIVEIYHGKDSGDHLSFERIKVFASGVN
ncbi:redoxin domain-containing protein [Methylomarinum sp. Ch1-1]|uniref:Redoxin domain-containing protein n=1 Tax=Methylomarinum roseum TaxID=3067653 RepID=A0AAU7NQW3_9GAMM|nr:redoxin domain-containing protein [Methylomarinum sp. Ch1-1]MDP4520692.1 redoxin domain-containing protein [Methylomarinum sp. Ch1-1]